MGQYFGLSQRSEGNLDAHQKNLVRWPRRRDAQRSTDAQTTDLLARDDIDAVVVAAGNSISPR